MVVRFGPKCEPGFLPVYSVDTEEEARRLLVMTCSRNRDGDFVARELAEEQTIGNLMAFKERLIAGHAWIRRQGKRQARNSPGA